MSYPTPARFSLANSKDEMVDEINRLRTKLNIVRPANEAWLPGIQKRTLLSIITELENIEVAKSTNSPHLQAMIDFAQLSDAEQEAELADKTYRLQHPTMSDTINKAQAAQAEAAKNENRKRPDPITDPAVTPEELAKAKQSDIDRLLEKMKTASSAEKRVLRARLRKHGYRLSEQK